MSIPRLSIIVTFYKMSRQAENTLYSLSAQFQRNVSENDYEIIAVENDSDDELGEARAVACGGNIRYFYRKEPGVSPVPALNFGCDQARGPLWGIIIDGARLVSPRVVEHALTASRLAEHPLVVVPGYHLGYEQHHVNKSAGYDEKAEQELLEKADWKNDGYALFDISCFSGANPKGFFCRFLESNCFFCTRESFNKIGRADPRFDLPGGGSVNIYLYHALARLPESRLIVLAGEGSFHQFHGGVTTEEVADREARIQTHRENLAMVFGGPFKGMHREPLIFGTMCGPVQRFVEASVKERQFLHFVWKQRDTPEFQTPDGGG